MNNPMYYEVTDISTPAEVHAAYKHSVENNVKYYRAISKANHMIYGWDTRKGQYIMLDSALKNIPESVEKVGDAYWFINDKYSELPVMEDVIANAAHAVAAAPVAETAPTPAQATATATAPAPAKTALADEDETPYVVDYKVLYERMLPKFKEYKKKADESETAMALFSSVRESLSKKTEEYNALKSNYLKVRDAQVKTLAAIDEIEETIEELKDEINSVKFLNLE